MSSCPIPLTHINVTRHVRDEYVDVLGMSTSAEQTPRSKHTMEATQGHVRLASTALCTLGFMLQMASGMRALALTTSFALTLPCHRGTTMCAFVSSLRGRGPWCGGGCSSLARCSSCRFPSDTVQLFCMMASHVVASCANSYIAESNQSFLQKGTVSVQMKSRRAPRHEDVPKNEHCLGRLLTRISSPCVDFTKKNLLGKLDHNLHRAFVNAESVFLYVLCNLCVLHDWCLALARAR